MKRILFLSYTNMLGGAEFVLCDYLKNNNVNDYYIYTTNKHDVIIEYKKYFLENHIYMSKNMNIVSIRKNPIIAVKNILYNLYIMYKIIHKNKIDILYGNNTLDLCLLIFYKKYVNNKIKIISHVHDIIEKEYIKKFINKNNKYVNIFIVPSEVTRKSLIGIGVEKQKIDVVYNGVKTFNKISRMETKSTLRKEYNITKDKIILGFVGQICERKRVDLFINIIDELNKRINNFIGIIVGKITEEKYYEEEIKNKMNDSIFYLGERDRESLFKDIYPQIDILLLTSDRDPLPTVILEAMSEGVLVIARDVDGVKEIIKNGKNGYIFNYNIKIEEIASFILDVLKKNNICIKEEGRKTIELYFSNKKKQEKINEIIKNI